MICDFFAAWTVKNTRNILWNNQIFYLIRELQTWGIGYAHELQSETSVHILYFHHGI